MADSKNWLDKLEGGFSKVVDAASSIELEKVRRDTAAAELETAQVLATPRDVTQAAASNTAPDNKPAVSGVQMAAVGVAAAVVLLLAVKALA